MTLITKLELLLAEMNSEFLQIGVPISVDEAMKLEDLARKLKSISDSDFLIVRPI